MIDDEIPSLLSPELNHQVETRLTQWAEWFIRYQDEGLGFPSQSIEYKLMTVGHVEKTRGRPQALPTNESAEEIEELVKEMVMIVKYEQEARALRLHYLSQRKNIPRKAREMGVSVSTFKSLIASGKRFIAGCLYGQARVQQQLQSGIKLLKR